MNPRRIALLLWLAGALAGWGQIPGQEKKDPNYSFRNWQVEDGLPHNSVHAICQTQDGYLWLGTGEGVVRFDGFRFQPPQATNLAEIQAAFVTALCEGADGSLWAAATGVGLFRVGEGRVTKYDAANGFGGKVVRSLYGAPDGSIWIGATNGLYQFRNGEFKERSVLPDGAPHTVRAIWKEADGSLLFAAAEGVYVLREDTLAPLNPGAGMEERWLRSLLRGRDGTLWLGSDGGLRGVRPTESLMYMRGNSPLPGFVTALAEDPQGAVWAGTHAGLFRWQQGQIQPEGDSGGPLSGTIFSLLTDREGNLWVGGMEGLTRISPLRCVSYTKEQGLTYNLAVSICQAKDDAMWIGTWGGGLNRWQQGKATLVPMPSEAALLVLGVGEMLDGTLWVGTDYQGGLFSYREGGVPVRYSVPEGMVDPAIAVVYVDRGQNLWLGTRQALVRYAEGEFTRFTAAEGLPGEMVRVITEDHMGNLWVGTDGGLSRMRGNSFENFSTKNGLSENSVVSIYEDAEETFWIGMRNGGLNRFRRGRFDACTTQDGLFNDYIYSILEDTQGRLWMSSARGVFWVDKKNLHEFLDHRTARIVSVPYGRLDGMSSTACKGVAKPAGWKARDGRFWYPTAKGVVAINPEIKVDVPPPVYVEEVRVNDEPVPAGAAREILAGEKLLAFQYTALSLVAPEKVRFRYRLDGFDTAWQEAGNRREALYARLREGNYTFRVQAMSGDGVASEREATWAFRVVPPWWQTRWFLTLALFGTIGLIGGAAHWISARKFRRQLRALGQQHAIEKERMRIARDMHDDLGGSLTQIAFLSDMAQRDLGQREVAAGHIGKIAASARQSTQALEEIVWAVHPENDTLDHLVSYLGQFAEEFFRATPVRCRMDVPPGVPAHPLSSETRHGLFLIVKEAMNNALKYAQATEIWLRVACGAKEFTITIEDNGQGFDLEKNRQTGNGLRNLEKRAAELGGRAEVETKPGRGTKWRITMPVG